MSPDQIEVVAPQTLPPLSVGMRDAARLIGISERRLAQLVTGGQIPFCRIDRRIVLRLASVDAWLAAREIVGVQK